MNKISLNKYNRFVNTIDNKLMLKKFIKKSFVVVHLLIVSMLTVVLGEVLPNYYLELLYSITLSFKDLLTFILPVIIFCCIFLSTLNIKGNDTASLIIILLIVFYLSNYIAVLIAYLVASLNLVIFQKKKYWNA